MFDTQLANLDLKLLLSFDCYQITFGEVLKNDEFLVNVSPLRSAVTMGPFRLVTTSGLGSNGGSALFFCLSTLMSTGSPIERLGIVVVAVGHVVGVVSVDSLHSLLGP